MKKLALVVYASVLCVASFAQEPFDIRETDEFARIVAGDSRVAKLAGEMRFVEGPVWCPRKGGFLIFSDIPANRLMKWDQAGGLGVFREPSQQANGNIFDGRDRLVTCEHQSRRVTITDPGAEPRVLVERYKGKRFNSPNDVAVHPDGTVWFTDPSYGLRQRPREIEGNYVFRLDPASESLTAALKDFDMPNGICFSPDGTVLYVADSGKPRHIRAFTHARDGGLSDGRILCSIDRGAPDGIRCDEAGRVFSSAADGVHILRPDGTLVGKILVPESPANLCFGGSDGKTLFITARKSLYAIVLKVRGAGIGSTRK